MSGEIPWIKERLVVGEHNAPGNPSSEIRITQYAASLSGVRKRFHGTANIDSVIGLPVYDGPDTMGRWTATWREVRKAGYENTARFGWYSKKKNA